MGGFNPIILPAGVITVIHSRYMGNSKDVPVPANSGQSELKGRHLETLVSWELT